MRTYIIFATYLMTFFGSIAQTSAEIVEKPGSHSPCDDHYLHICAFHIAKDDPNIVIETQHYCTPLHDDLFQCLLYETTDQGVRPKLIGIEYVISDDLYQKLTLHEKSLWHPHDFEVRQGLLATIGASKEEDRKMIKVLVKTWGKTWHTWPDPKTDLPLGFPRLMWSAVKDGDVSPEMVKKRDQRWGIDTSQLKKERDQYLPAEL